MSLLCFVIYHFDPEDEVRRSVRRLERLHLKILKKKQSAGFNQKYFDNNLLPKYTPDIGMMVRVFANGPRDLSSIPGRVIPKTQKKIVLDASLINTQYYKIRIKGKVELAGKIAIEKGAFSSPSTKVANFTYTYII